MSLGNLRQISLIGCEQLIEVPDLSGAPNLHVMDLDGCSNLTKLSKISRNVKKLYLVRTAVEEIPSLRHLTSLETLCLNDCSNFSTFPQISSAITHLSLSETAIEEVPNSAIKSLNKLVSLDLSYNTRLKNLPSLRHLISLETLYLDGCSNITKFPQISEAITSLFLSGTAIDEVSNSAIESLYKLVSLYIRDNTRLKNLPSMSHLTSLRLLHLEGCSNITEFPEISVEITNLCLSGTAIEEIPSFVERFINLQYLTLDHCRSLKRVSSGILRFPLPSRLEFVDASHCISLETLPDTTVVSTGKLYFQYYNCLKLDVKACINIHTDVQTRIQLMAINAQETRKFLSSWSCFPGSEIPEWVSYQNEGSSLTIDLPPHWYNNNFFGLVLCIVASCDSSDGGYSTVDCTCNFIDSDCDCQENICDLEISHYKTTWEHPKTDHVFVTYSESGEVDSGLSSMYSLCQKVRFQFSPINDCCKVKKCGVHLVYSESKDDSTESGDHDIAKEDQEEDSQNSESRLSQNAPMVFQAHVADGIQFVRDINNSLAADEASVVD
ncbi:hypothetical protein EZV62_001200 [Acer yangbiense]|uniref:C-JID domain-containing protein n=1 Tax=Acer yangbiense TaxID=1000413 RepID=A0A5C7ITJ9_9ROSI|nr:hypothetical protein EZV62_001200 [Acer yangbiense]